MEVDVNVQYSNEAHRRGRGQVKASRERGRPAVLCLNATVAL